MFHGTHCVYIFFPGLWYLLYSSWPGESDHNLWRSTLWVTIVTPNRDNTGGQHIHALSGNRSRTHLCSSQEGAYHHTVWAVGFRMSVRFALGQTIVAERVTFWGMINCPSIYHSSRSVKDLDFVLKQSRWIWKCCASYTRPYENHPTLWG